MIAATKNVSPTRNSAPTQVNNCLPIEPISECYPENGQKSEQKEGQCLAGGSSVDRNRRNPTS
jgi:hypothetical protein